MRLVVRVQPNAKRTHVGGRFGDQEPPALKVRVTAPAVDGKANAAVVAAVADALGISARAVSIVAGATSRTKTLVVDGVDAAAVQQLLDAG
jgi:uncharacterized protein (TIGR00251 family)